MFRFLNRFYKSGPDNGIENYHSRFRKIIEILLDKNEFFDHDLRFFSVLSKCKCVTIVKLEDGEIHEKFISPKLLGMLGEGGLIGDIGKKRLLDVMAKARKTPGIELFTDITIKDGRGYLNVIYYEKSDDYDLFFISKEEHDKGHEDYLKNNITRDINIINSIVGIKDNETLEHTLRVGEISHHIGELLGLDEDFLKKIRMLAPLHDIGKIKIPDNILLRDGSLDEEENEIMKLHTVYGGELIERLDFIFLDEKKLNFAKNIVLHHHEWYDGTGYPDGLMGDNIPLEARIVSIADAFDVSKNRDIEKGYTDEQIIKMLKELRGKKFDPKILDMFLGHYYEMIGIRAVYEDHKDGES